MPKKELWKHLKHKSFKNYYKISNLGNIKNIRTGIILKPYSKSGYKSVSLYSPLNKIYKTFRIHRLVAEKFCVYDKKDKELVINHLNGNKLDNRAVNLEWTTYKKNTEHAIKNKLNRLAVIPIVQYNKNGKKIKEFDSISNACTELHICRSCIYKVCIGIRKTAGGFVWKYKNSKKNLKINLKDAKKIPNYPKYYITRYGKVYSTCMKVGKFLIPRKNPNGYLAITLSKCDRKKTLYIHRLVAQAFIPNPYNKKVVNHKDRNKHNNRVDNLEWTSSSENTRHYYKNK